MDEGTAKIFVYVSGIPIYYYNRKDINSGGSRILILEGLDFEWNLRF